MPTTSLGSYTLELSRWGITPGLPTKHIEVINSVNVNCYSDADYLKAYNNIIGFNNATTWAYDNGFRQLVVPFGQYAVCYSNISDNDKENRIVIDYSNLILDLNGSTFKAIYDSSKRSPYDKTKTGSTWGVSTAAPFMLGGTVFTIRDCNFTELKNGILIGDKIDRDFTVQLEVSRESTTGVSAGGNCKYINVENMDISFFMADGISVSFGKKNTQVKVGYDMAWQLGDLDTNGLLITSTNHCVSGYIAVDSNTPHFLQGYGFTQGMTALKNKKYSAYFYDVNHTYITKETAFTLQNFTTTKFTKYIRLVIEEKALDPAVPGVTTGGWQMVLRTGIYGSYLTYQNNYIHHNHRGGMSQTLNDTFVINNHFYNNGEQFDYENNLPGFPSSTRYHINVEDTQGYNMHIIGNKFENGRFGIAIRGYNCVIKDNWFKDCIGVILYRLHYAVIKDNYFDDASFDTYTYDSSYNDFTDYYRNWHIEGNTIDGAFDIRGTAIVNSISNNIFKNVVNIASTVNVFRNNTFTVDRDNGYNDQVSLKTVANIDGCTFTKKNQSTVNNSIVIQNALVTNCIFKNLKVRVQNVIVKDSFITDSGFDITTGTLKMNRCKISHGTYLLKNNYPVFPNNSALLNLYDTTKIVDVEFNNCDIISTSAQPIFGSAFNALAANASLRLEDTKITKMANNKLGIGVFNGKLNFINTTISSEILVPNITPNSSLTHRFSDCIFTNVSFTVKTSDIQYSQQDIGVLAKPLSGNGVPTGIPRKMGEEYYDLTNKKLYKAFGTAANTDWIIMN